MKIDFELLDELAKAGATAQVIIMLLKKQHARGDAKRERDRTAVSTKRTKPVATMSDIQPVGAKTEKRKAPVKMIAPKELPLEVTNGKAAVVVKAKKRRIEDGWKLDAGNMDYGRRIGLSEAECAKEWVKFCGHHGAKGTEFVDWNKAWQNWARNSLEFTGRVPRDANKPLDEEPPREVNFSLEQWKRVLVIYASNNNWNSSWGPPPGEIGCRVPPQLLVEEKPEFEDVEVE